MICMVFSTSIVWRREDKNGMERNLRHHIVNSGVKYLERHEHEKAGRGRNLY